MACRLKGQFSSGVDNSGGGKVEREAVVIKEQGNNHFKKKELEKSLLCYSEAVFTSVWPSDDKLKILTQLLSHLEPYKCHAAAELFASEHKDDDLETPLLAVCIGNRSAVLYEMNRAEECLADIELALSLNFPAASEHKLYRRRACCLARLGNKAGAIDALETAEKKCTSCSQSKKDQIIRETHKKMEYLLQEYQQSGVRSRGSRSREFVSGHSVNESSSLTPDSCPSKGRFLRAAGPISAGEVVMAEEAYVAVLNFDLQLTHCSYCFHKTSALIPCCWCTSDGYCSSGCKEKAWEKYHWLECSVTHLWIKADWMMRVALRMLVSVPANTLHGAISKALDENEPYASILSLVSHQDKFSDTQQKSMFIKMVDTMMECFGDVIKEYLHVHEEIHLSSFTHDGNDFGLRSLFLLHLLQLRCNSHSVTAMETEVDGEGEGGKVVQSSREIQVGSAIFPTACLFNHSCWPNIIFRFVGSSVVAVATKPIGKGEEVNSCYGPQVGRMKRLERMAELQRKYFFHCSCPACAKLDASLEYREMVVDAYGCSECGGAVVESGVVVTQWQCHDCHRILDSREIKGMHELLSETERMFSAAQDTQVSDEANLPLLLKCHALQSQVLHKHNMQLARTSDAVAHSYACKGEFVKAAEFCAAGCRAVEAVHGSHSIELATELHKLAQLLFNSQQVVEAVDVVEKALPILRVYFQPDHPDIIELQQMRDYLTTTDH